MNSVGQHQEDQGDEDSAASVECWTREEKFELYKAIKSFGSSDIDNISDYIKTKSKDQVIRAIIYYKEMVKQSQNKKPRCLMTKRFIDKKLFGEGQLPLTYWEKQLLEHKSLKNLQTDTAAALRMIADLEPIPSKICTSNIDFKDLYRLVADAIEGRPLKANTDYSSIIENALVETALTSKSFISQSTLQKQFTEMYNNLNVEDNVLSFVTVDSSQEEKLIIQLVNTENYNPFHLTEISLQAGKKANKK